MWGDFVLLIYLFLLFVVLLVGLAYILLIRDSHILSTKAADAAPGTPPGTPGARKRRLDPDAVRMSGWVTARRTFQPNGGFFGFGSSNKLTASEAKKLEIEAAKAAESANGGETSYAASLAQMYKRATEDKPPGVRERLWAELKDRTLRLYEDDKKANCVAEIEMARRDVRMWTKKGEFNGRDTRLFNKKKNMIALLRNEASSPDSSDSEQKDDIDSRKTIYISCATCPLMEAWYLALLDVSRARERVGVDKVFSENHWQDVLDTVSSEPDVGQFRWLNAFLARVFLGMYRTQFLEDVILEKLRNKISRLDSTGWLSNLAVESVMIGSTVPWFSKPILKDTDSSGSTSFMIHVKYDPRIDATDSRLKMTFSGDITLPALGKTVHTVISIYLKHLDGDLQVMINPPPSNRFWYGFISPPAIEFDIVPHGPGLKRFGQIGVIKKLASDFIKSRLYDALVLPNMDDIAFFSTMSSTIRGGIFSSHSRDARGVFKLTPETLETRVSEALAPAASADSMDPPQSFTSRYGLSTLRFRSRGKAQTTAPVINDVSGDEESEPVSRVESAPVSMSRTSSQESTTSRLFGLGGRKITKSSGSTESETVTGVKGANASADVMSVETLERSVLSTEVPSATSVATPDKKKASFGSRGSSPTSLKTSLTGLVRRISPDRGSGNAKSASILSTEGPATMSVAEGSSLRAGAASFLNEVRGRDREAPIRTQAASVLETTRSFGHKSWTDFKARRAERAAQTTAHPAPVYRPVDVEEQTMATHQRSSSMSQNQPLHLELKPTNSPNSISLQDRLSAATRSAPVELPAPTRNRASSIGSNRLSLVSSPPAKSALGTTPPQGWTLAKPQVLPPKEDTSKMAPNPTTVSRQPSAGRSMVVPRVPKRPGELVAMGSGGPEGLVRRISSGEESQAKPETSERKDDVNVPAPSAPVSHTSNTVTAIQPPTLPPRRPSLSTSSPDSAVATTFTSASQLAQTSEAPRLPPRKLSMASPATSAQQSIPEASIGKRQETEEINTPPSNPESASPKTHSPIMPVAPVVTDPYAISLPEDELDDFDGDEKVSTPATT